MPIISRRTPALPLLCPSNLTEDHVLPVFSYHPSLLLSHNAVPHWLFPQPPPSLARSGPHTNTQQIVLIYEFDYEDDAAAGELDTNGQMA